MFSTFLEFLLRFVVVLCSSALLSFVVLCLVSVVALRFVLFVAFFSVAFCCIMFHCVLSCCSFCNVVFVLCFAVVVFGFV